MASPRRAPLGFALLAYNAAETLPRTLASIRPYCEQVVVAVDERTTDKTAKVAKKAGADVVETIQVSDWHECPVHGKILVQHFAEARNRSFALLDPALDWHAWIDADDELIGGDKLAAICARCPAESVGVWANYVYAHNKGPAGEIVPNTEFYRERLFRTRVGDRPIQWRWQHRVHEVCAPVGIEASWTLTGDLVWVHQHGAHKTESSAPRNDRCLEVEFEESPNNPRTLFYLGNSKFAQGEWPEAAAFYERLLDLEDGNVYQNWQAATYLCKAHLQTGDVGAATLAAYRALDVRPDHPDPYFDLARCYAVAGEDDKALFWTKLARQAMAGAEPLVTRPPFFVFVNPMDYSYNARLPIAEVHAKAGRLAQSREELEAAQAVLPSRELATRIADLRLTEARMSAANAFVQTAEVVRDPEAILRVYAGLPDEVKAFGRARDAAIPLLMAQRDERFAA